MAAGEQYATEHGATSIGLHVFGHNLVARRLYDQLGHQVSSTHMIKSLTSPAERWALRLARATGAPGRPRRRPVR